MLVGFGLLAVVLAGKVRSLRWPARSAAGRPEADGEEGAVARFALRLDAAAVGGRDLAGYREAEATAAGGTAAGPVGPPEAVEDLRQAQAPAVAALIMAAAEGALIRARALEDRGAIAESMAGLRLLLEPVLKDAARG